MNKTEFVSVDWLKPKRATKGSAGYDFIAPRDVTIPPHWDVDFDTEVRVDVEEGYVLQLYIRSSLGRKGLCLMNAVGIIDSDYHLSMRAMIRNNSDEPYTIHKGDRYMQGLIMPYFLTADDDCTEERTGGLGSTGK